MRGLLVTLLVLAGCADSGAAPQYSPDTFPVTMHWYEDAAELRTASIVRGVPVEAEAFSVMTYRGDSYRCEIHMVRPADLSAYTQELIGHEFAHCLFGDWHQ
jgi:hypothetical protein